VTAVREAEAREACLSEFSGPVTSRQPFLMTRRSSLETLARPVKAAQTQTAASRASKKKCSSFPDWLQSLLDALEGHRQVLQHELIFEP
jgi:hypothetical protein